MEFYTVEDAELNQYYQLPKTIVNDEKYKGLTANEKIAYAILKDRHSLSIKNQWIDSENRVYFIFTDKELAEILDTTPRTANKIKNNLKKHGLIHMERQGLNQPNILYLIKPKASNDTDRKKSSYPDRKKISNQDKKKTSNQDRKKTSTKLTDSSNTDFNNTESSNNLYLDQMIDYIWKMKVPMQLKKYFHDRVKEMVKDPTFDITKIEYFYNSYADYIIPDCTIHDVMSLNDIEFTDTIIKMHQKVSRPIKNMEGLIKTWVQTRIHYKMENLDNIDIDQDMQHEI